MKHIKKILVLMLCIGLIVTGGYRIDANAKFTPRLLVTGYDINKSEVFAGDEFELTLHMKNTSTANNVYNIKLSLSSADNEFMCADGVATVYIEKIDANSEMDVVVKLKARSDLMQKPYILTVKTVYEDYSYITYEEVTNLAIDVKQETRVSVTDIDVSPNISEIGSKANICFSVNNQGKNKIYNVNVLINGNGVEGETSFIGNIESGATGYYDSSVNCVELNDGKVEALITYEDADGNIKEVKQEIQLEIIEQIYEPEIDMDDVSVQPEKAFPVSTVIFVVVVVVLIIVLIAVKRKRRKEEEDEIS